MAVRSALRLDLTNRPGELAKALRPIAQAGVNLNAIAGVATGQSSLLALLPSDLPAAMNALQHAGVSAEQVDVVVTWLPNRPGSLLAACDALGGAGINIDAVYVVSTDPAQGVQVTIECHDAKQADQVLGGVKY
jgi:hypothetical protein